MTRVRRHSYNHSGNRWTHAPARSLRRVGVVVMLCLLLSASPSMVFAQGPELQLRPAPSSEQESLPSPGNELSGQPPAAGAPPVHPPSPPPQMPLAQALNVRGDLTLRNSTLSGALYTIGELWGINVVSGKLDGNVNGVFRKAPLREILDTILLSNGYGYRAVGESLVVTELERLGQVNPFFESATITVAVADVNDVVSGAELLSTPQGKIQAIPSARSLFVLDFPDRVQMIREFAAALDLAASRAQSGHGSAAGIGPQRLEVAYMKSHYVSAKTASEVITSVLSPFGKVTAMEDEDRLLVVDYAENLDIAQRVLERIDRPRPQVSIRSLIYDLSLTDIEQLGINWTHITNGTLGDATVTQGGAIDATGTLNTGTGTLFNSVTAAPFADGASGGAFTLYNLGSNLSLAAVALMLQQADDSRLLASPNVTVTENEKALIQAVSEIPFQQLTQTQGGGNIGTTAFKEAGITLEVEPKIARDMTVEMVVRPEFSLLAGFTPGENQPIIDRRTAQTTVRVANGHTLVLGGMRQRSDVGSFAGIPFLKDVRLIGNLFRSRTTNIRESELVVFITPTIVGYDTPPSERDRLVADTTLCQLNRIPPAEGCCGSNPAMMDCCDQPGTTPVIHHSSLQIQPPRAASQTHAAASRPTGSGNEHERTTASQMPRRLPSPNASDSKNGRGASPAVSLRPGFNERYQSRGWR